MSGARVGLCRLAVDLGAAVWELPAGKSSPAASDMHQLASSPGYIAEGDAGEQPDDESGR